VVAAASADFEQRRAYLRGEGHSAPNGWFHATPWSQRYRFLVSQARLGPNGKATPQGAISICMKRIDDRAERPS
jgi:hypothetical protein